MMRKIYQFGYIDMCRGEFPLSLTIFTKCKPFPWGHLKGRYARNRAVRKPSPLRYWGNFTWLDRTDYPVMDDGPLIVSRRLFDWIRELGPLSFREVPIAVYGTARWTGKRLAPPWSPWNPPDPKNERVTRKSSEWVGLTDLEVIELVSPRQKRLEGRDLDCYSARLVDRPTPAIFCIDDVPGSHFLSEDAVRFFAAKGARVRFEVVNQLHRT